MSIGLLIADDHQLFRSGLRQMCEVKGGFAVLAEAENGRQAVTLVRQHQPDVILMDIRMPSLSGVEATRLIIEESPEARILMLTMYQQEHHVLASLKAGACGYLLKSASPEALFDAIRAAYSGSGWLDPDITPAILAHLPEHESHLEVNDKEIELLRLVAHGANNQSIATRLHLSAGTVGNRLRVIFEKLNVNNRTEAALYALRQGWASLDPED